MKFIIPVVVGGAIGYFTNWLAIKMLFRPYEEKRIFGIKIPFTPGLIPKERLRVAKNIGSTVGVHLLSTDTIIESLENQKIEEKTNKWIENKIDKLKEDEKTLDELLDNIFKENKDYILISSKARIVKLILSQKDKVKKLLINLFNNKINNLNTDKLYLDMENFLKDQLSEITESEDIRNEISSYLNKIGEDNRTLKEIIPENMLDSAYAYIDENKSKIGGEIRNTFKDPIIQLQIKSSISEMITKNLNKMFFALISPEIISEKIYQAVEKYLDDEETDEDIVFLLKILIEKLLKSKVADIVSAVEESTDNKGIEGLTDKIMSLIQNKKNHNIIINLIKEKLVQSEVENKEKIMEKIEIELNKFMDSLGLENSIWNLADKVEEEILNKEIGYFFAKIDKENMDKIYKLTGILFKRFASKELPKIIELFNIEKIVEDKINSFPVEYFEELILEISQKELKAITWLGGLLGGILGLLSPLLQMIY